jgi:hypothetical protein
MQSGTSVSMKCLNSFSSNGFEVEEDDEDDELLDDDDDDVGKNGAGFTNG